MSRKLRRIYHTLIFIVCKGTKNQALNQNKYHKLTLRYPKYDTKPQKRKIQTVLQKSPYKPPRFIFPVFPVMPSFLPATDWKPE
jgi:hypothetical protein